MQNDNINEESVNPTGDGADTASGAEAANETTAYKAQIDTLTAQIEEFKANASAERDKYIRLAAEYDNFRKRSIKDRTQAIANTRASDAASFLGVTDNLYRALNAECSDANYKKGVEMIAAQFENVLTKLGVTEIEASGKPFDPNIHNAINFRQDENFPDNTVCEVVQKGYMLEDKLIRPALVVVANP